MESICKVGFEQVALLNHFKKRAMFFLKKSCGSRGLRQPTAMKVTGTQASFDAEPPSVLSTSKKN
jgi:hypothetical protein